MCRSDHLSNHFCLWVELQRHEDGSLNVSLISYFFSIWHLFVLLCRQSFDLEQNTQEDRNTALVRVVSTELSYLIVQYYTNSNHYHLRFANSTHFELAWKSRHMEKPIQIAMPLKKWRCVPNRCNWKLWHQPWKTLFLKTSHKMEIVSQAVFLTNNGAVYSSL